MRRDDHLAGGGIEQLQSVRHRLAGILGFDGRRIGGVDPDELAGLVAQPDRHRRHRQHGAHGLDFRGQRRVALLHLGKGQAVAGQVAEARHRRAADRRPAHLDQPVGPAGDGEGEGLATLAHAGDALVELAGRIGRQPFAESEEIGAADRRAGDRRQRTGDQRRLARHRPRHQTLVLVVDQRLGAVERRLELADFRDKRRVLAFGAEARAIERDHREHGEEHRAHHRHQGDDLRRAEIDGRKTGCGKGGTDRQRSEEGSACRCTNPRRIPAMPAHAEHPLASPHPDTRGVWLVTAAARASAAHRHITRITAI